MPLTSGDIQAAQVAATTGDYRFRLVRDGHDDELFATYPAARRAANTLGGKVRTYTPPPTE